jgi:hypothetical protein
VITISACLEGNTGVFQEAGDRTLCKWQPLFPRRTNKL